MEVKIQSVKFDASKQLIEFVEKKMSRLERFESNSTGVDVILKLDKDSEKGNKLALVTLHVPETANTKGMIGAEQFAKMKDKVRFINASRGTVVDIDALADALRSGKVAGAAVDVYPKEPSKNGEEFVTPLREFDNVILTPHIGAGTEEAQRNIGTEVAEKLALYSDNGSTLTAVNFPEVSLPRRSQCRSVSSYMLLQPPSHRCTGTHRGPDDWKE